MTPSVLKLKYLSIYWFKIQKKEWFWKAEVLRNFDYSNFSTRMCAVLLIKILGTSMCFCWTVTIIAVWVFVHYPSCCCSIIHFIKYLFPASLQINKYALKKEKNNTAIHFHYHRRLLAVNRLYIYDHWQLWKYTMN